ncbi:unnamed protein product, partial [marine sediment metagenome]
MTCGQSANNKAAFKVRFRTNASNSAEYAYVDDVEISGTSFEPVHDVAVMAITAPASVVAGDIATIDVTVENQGTFNETFDVTLTDTPPPQGGTAGVVTDSPQTITLGPGISITVSFPWDTVGATPGGHTLVATAVLVTDEDMADNSLSTTSTVVEAGSTVYVSNIVMAIISGKKYSATAIVEIFDALGGVEGATVVGDWYFKGVLRLSGVTEETGANGTAMLTSLETPAKTGDTFTFTVTDVA